MEGSKNSQASTPVRARLLISGRVQGVYFRAAARQEAQAQQLTGWVRNRPDGHVEAVVEGEEAAVQRFVAWCHSGPPGAQVTAVQVTIEPSSGVFDDFRITG
jgi:acylphosphatase